MGAKHFTSTEIAYIKENFERMQIKDIAKALGRHEISVMRRCRKLGLRKYAFYSDEDRKSLVLLYNTMPNIDIAARLRRSKYSVMSFAKRNHVLKNAECMGKWSDAEIDYLMKHMVSPYSDIARTIGRSINACKIKAHKMGLKRLYYAEGSLEIMI